MSRSRHNSTTDSVSLFPFLAVLLCTMGALIMLLVAMTHVSRRQATADLALEPAEQALALSSEPTPNEAEVVAREKEFSEAQAALEQAEEQQSQVAQALHEDQLRLSQAEDHIRRMTDHFASLQSAIAELSETEAEHYDDQALAQRNLSRIEDLVAEARAEIEELKEQAKSKKKHYSIVPYKGSKGTRRRPLYIECRNNRVYLQPEGVELTIADFQRPLGVGNPLAAALRASREYYVRDNPQAGYDPDAEPYPLILVRPDGIERYLDVREAIRSWDSDFGYEMVDGEWELDFPAPNPELHSLQTRAVVRARMRRELLARAAPRVYGGGGGGGYTGGSSRIPTSTRPPSSGKPYDGAVLGQSSNGQSAQRARGAVPSLATGREGNQPGRFGATGEGDQSAFRGSDRVAAERALQQQDSTKPFAAAQTGGAASKPPSQDAPDARQNAGAQAIASAAGQPSPQAGANQQGSPGQPASAGSPSSGAASSTNMVPVAVSRGANWAVDQKSPQDIAIQRSVQVLVRNDRLVLLPGRDRSSRTSSAERRGKTVYLQGTTNNGLDEFVMTVQQQVKGWGIAGQGLYWRPVLMLNVAPDGTRRARDLVQLLQRSGMDVRFERTAALPSTEAPSGGANR